MSPPRHWQSHNGMSRLLMPMAWLYGAALRVKLWFYQLGVLKPYRLPVPVIVVGNVLAGGVGKTPVVMALVAHLRTQGLAVGIVSRGYGRRDKGVVQVLPESDPSVVGDEPLLLLRETGAVVFVGEQREQAAKALLGHAPRTQVIVSDDGLQRWSMARDIEVIVFDERGLGNGLLLPAGPLREWYPRRSERAAFQFVLDQPKRVLADEAVDAQGHRVELASLGGRVLHAVAAIAKPDAFFDMLKAKGLTLATTRGFPDHDDLKGYALPPPGDERVLCTAKDAVKLWARRPDVLAVPLEVQLDPYFLKAIDALMEALVLPPPPQ